MYQTPKALKQGPFFSEPDHNTSSRNIKVTYMPQGEKQFAAYLSVERADVPDLIKLLQDSYGL